MPTDQQPQAAAAINDDAHPGDASVTPKDAEGVDAEADGRKAMSRDELYKRLGAVDDVDAEEAVDDAKTDEIPQAEEAASSESDPSPAAEEEAKSDLPDTGEDPEAETPEAPENKEEETAKDNLLISQEDKVDLLGRVPDKEWRALPTVTRQRINALRATTKEQAKRVEELEAVLPLADYGDKVRRFARTAKMTDDDLSVWLEVGAVVQTGGQPAIDELLNMARNLGWKGEAAHAAAPTGARLPDWLQAKVDALEISEEAARDILARMPAPEEAKPKERPKAPRFGPSAEEMAAGKAVLAEKTEAAQRRFGADWNRLWPQIERTMLRKRGAHPSAWGDLFDLAVETVVQQHRQPARKIGRDEGLPPGSSRKITVDPNKFTGRKRAYALAGYRPK